MRWLADLNGAVWDWYWFTDANPELWIDRIHDHVGGDEVEA